jgi:ABC-type transporter Mla subunit MlaD
VEREAAPTRTSSRPAPALRPAPGPLAGLRVASATAALAALGGLGALGVGLALERVEEPTRAALARELELRRQAGAAALAALDEVRVIDLARTEAHAALVRREALARATARVLVASARLDRALGDTTPPELAKARALVVRSNVEDEDVRLALVDRRTGLVLEGAALGLTRGATLAEVGRALAVAKAGEPTLLADRVDGLIVAGPEPTAGSPWILVAQPRITASAPPSGGIARATSALVELGVEPELPAPLPSATPLFALGALLGACVAFLWTKLRLGGPLARTLDRARAFVHGANDARADEGRGGRDARDVAREVNALIERAERLKAQGRAARDEDVHAVVVAVERLGRGDLATPTPDVQEALEPVARALDHARRELIERLSELHQVAVDTASSARSVAPGAQKLATAAAAQLEALRTLGSDADRSAEQVRGASRELGAALEGLGAFAEAERRIVQDVRTTLRASVHRADELRRGAERLQGVARTSEALREALALLATIIDLPPGDPAVPTKARLSIAVGEGRAALDEIQRELGHLEGELANTSQSLEALARAVPEAAPSMGAGVTATLHDAATALSRAAEVAATGMRTLERSAVGLRDATADIEDGVRGTAELGPRLGALLAGFSLGHTFERELLERLERWKSEAEAAAAAPDGLTVDGRQAVRQIIEAAEEARLRLGRLATATDAAMDALRS